MSPNTPYRFDLSQIGLQNQQVQNPSNYVMNWAEPNQTITQGNGQFNPQVFGSLAGANGGDANPTPGLLSKAWNGLGEWAGSDTGKFLFGGVNDQGIKNSGFLSDAFGIGSQVAGAWTGMKQLDLAKKQFNLQKDLMTKNYNAQRGLTNTRLKDRQNARNAADKDFYQDTGSYMKENEVK